MVIDEFPNTNILTIQLQDMVQSCLQCFQIRRTRTLNRHTFLSQMQTVFESLHQIWNVLNLAILETEQRA